ncbi:MAG: nicotinamidase [bacterium]|nr:nicotinamidase [bacterium]
MSLPLPDFYDPDTVGNIYLERAAQVAEAALTYQRQHHILPATQDSRRIAAFGIDCQVGFCTPGASLFVEGAVGDTQRTLVWLYRNLDKLTGLLFSLDTHRVFQIFHPAWWTDAQGRHPAPLSTITADEVRGGVWTPMRNREACLEYCEKLEASGKYVLTIWPYHVLLGGISHTLVPAMMEAAIFHSLVRQQQTHFEIKGEHPMTENYSVLSPEVQELGGQSVGGFNRSFFELLLGYDRVYVFGQAKSHCVRATLLDIRDHLLATNSAWTDKIWILEDAMSSVPAPPLDPLPPELDFPRLAEQTMAECRQAGMQVVKTTDPIVF